MAISDTPPPKSFQRGGKIVFPFNVVEKQITDPQTGQARVQYEYDEAEGSTAVTAQQVAAAKVAFKLAALADMTYDQLDTYIDTNVTNIATAKVFLKKLAKVVLAMVKMQDK